MMYMSKMWKVAYWTDSATQGRCIAESFIVTDDIKTAIDITLKEHPKAEIFSLDDKGVCVVDGTPKAKE